MTRTNTATPPATTPVKVSPAAPRESYNALAPVGDANRLKALLETQRDSLAKMLPKHITPERLFKTLLVSMNRTPQLAECTQASILETVNRAAELGLDLSGTLGEAYPVPFNNKVRDGAGREVWAMQCTMIIGYRGLEKLAWQSGEIASIDAEVVYTNDDFKFKKGTEVVVEWTPAIRRPRGEPVGAYACVTLKSGGKLARFLTVEDIEKIRNSAKSKNSPAWNNWWDEMARKCALKRTLKDAPLSTEKFVAAMEYDASDFDFSDVTSAETSGSAARGVAGLRNRLAAPAAARLVSPEDEAAQIENLRRMTDEKRAAGGSDSTDRAGDGETVDTQTGEVTGGDGGESQTSGESEDTGSQDRGGDGGGEESQEPPKIDLSDYSRAYDAIEKLAEARSVSPEDFRKSIDKHLLVIGMKGKSAKLSAEQLQTMYARAVAGEGAFESFAGRRPKK